MRSTRVRWPVIFVFRAHQQLDASYSSSRSKMSSSPAQADDFVLNQDFNSHSTSFDSSSLASSEQLSLKARLFFVVLEEIDFLSNFLTRPRTRML